jgi:hypothetical protein
VPNSRIVLASALVLSPLRGLRFLLGYFPRLAPWAAFFRRFAAFVGNSPRVQDRDLAAARYTWAAGSFDFAQDRLATVPTWFLSLPPLL